MKEALARHLTGASGVSSILQMHFELLHAHGGLGRVAPRWRENADQIVAYGEVLRRRDEDEPSPLDGGFSQQGAVDPQFDLVDDAPGWRLVLQPGIVADGGDRHGFEALAVGVIGGCPVGQ